MQLGQILATKISNRDKRILQWMAILVMVIGTGCNLTQLPKESGSILFQDTFSSAQSGWDQYSDATYRAEYIADAYRITVFDADSVAWSVPRLTFSDVIIDVNARKLKGPDDNVFGVICRYEDPDNFYFFLISSDAYSGIGVYESGVRTLLSGETMLPSDFILLGEGTNALHIECVGDRLSLSVNGHLIGEVQGASKTIGDVGLIAGTSDTSGVQIEFDDFIVANP